MYVLVNGNLKAGLLTSIRMGQAYLLFYLAKVPLSRLCGQTTWKNNFNHPAVSARRRHSGFAASETIALAMAWSLSKDHSLIIKISASREGIPNS